MNKYLFLLLPLCYYKIKDYYLNWQTLVNNSDLMETILTKDKLKNYIEEQKQIKQLEEILEIQKKLKFFLRAKI